MKHQLRARWNNSTIRRSANVLSKSDRRKILLVIILQIFLSVLDLIGVALIGLLSAISITGIQSKAPTGRIYSILEYIGLESQTLQFQVATLGILAGLFLIIRSICSVYIYRRVLFFLSRRGAVITSKLILRLLSNSLLEIQSRSTQQTVFALTQGVSVITLGVLGTTISLISDAALLIIMTTGLLVVDPVIALVTFLIFLSLAIFLYRKLAMRARNLGVKDSKLTILGNERIVEVLTSFRESIVRNRRQYYANEIGDIRLAQADTLAEMAFMPSINKYVIESAVVFIALIIGATQFAIQDASHAISTLSIFLAAGSRIAPAVLRMQQGILQIKGSLGSASPTLELIENLVVEDTLFESTDFSDPAHEGFVPIVSGREISLTYPGSVTPALSGVNFKINSGDFVAIVGASGAGKTSIVDVMLGVLKPDRGEIRISNLSPREAFHKWPGAVAYVPQDVAIINGTIRENIILGFPERQDYESLVNIAIDKAHLRDFVNSLPDGINTQVGERGTSLSGGQRQRLGIARALFTNPKLLVLDEATSALDGETEANISSSLSEYKGEISIVVIAHRLSTIREADQVIYFENGRVLATGSFEEIRNKVIDFDRQAKLMGL